MSSGGNTYSTTILGGGTLEVASGGNTISGITFSGVGGTLKYDSGAVATTPVSGFVQGDTSTSPGLLSTAPAMRSSPAAISCR